MFKEKVEEKVDQESLPKSYVHDIGDAVDEIGFNLDTIISSIKPESRSYKLFIDPDKGIELILPKNFIEDPPDRNVSIYEFILTIIRLSDKNYLLVEDIDVKDLTIGSWEFTGLVRELHKHKESLKVNFVDIILRLLDNLYTLITEISLKDYIKQDNRDRAKLIYDFSKYIERGSSYEDLERFLEDVVWFVERIKHNFILSLKDMKTKPRSYVDEFLRYDKDLAEYIEKFKQIIRLLRTS